MTIKGKTLVTTDWHFGIKGNQVNRLNILIKVTNEIVKYIKENKIDNFLFCGDLFHSRNVLSIQTIDIALKCINCIAKVSNVYLILGNHDLFNKNSVDINSIKMFRSIPNITVIDHPTECDMNGSRILLAPWLSDLSVYKHSEFDMIFGHFDISTNYLISSYIEDNIKKNMTNKQIKDLISNDSLLQESGLEDLDFEIENVRDTFVNHKQSSELIGSWIEIVKEKGTVFSGHIHGHKEFWSKGRKFIFIGSPYQQTRGEINSEDGFYIIDDNNEYTFHRIENVPVHVDLKISDIVKDIDSFDFSIVTGNIIHKIYDIEIDRVTDAKITQKITDRKPYEELTPDYDIVSTDSSISSDSIDLIRRSKLEYLHSYISNIDESVLKEKNIDRDKLFSVLKEYYDMVNEEN